MENKNFSPEEINNLYLKLNNDAEKFGYHLNPDIEFTKELVKGLIINQKRYGYPSCPCRLSTGKKESDIDIICPCDYRDSDLNEFEACYCALYVSDDIISGKKELSPIPERRLPKEERKTKKQKKDVNLSSLAYPVWRCKVCGYLCAKDAPPGICPICKAKKDRFKQFI